MRFFECFAPSEKSKSTKALHAALPPQAQQDEPLKKVQEQLRDAQEQLRDAHEKHIKGQKQVLAELEKTMQDMQQLERQKIELAESLQVRDRERQLQYAQLEIAHLEATSRLKELETRGGRSNEDSEMVERLALMASTQAQVQRRLSSIVAAQEQEREQHKAELFELKELHKAEVVELASALDTATTTADTAVKKYETAVQKYTKLQRTTTEIRDELNGVKRERDDLSDRCRKLQAENSDILSRLGEATAASGHAGQQVSSSSL